MPTPGESDGVPPAAEGFGSGGISLATAAPVSGAPPLSQIDFDPADLEPRPFRPPSRRRMGWIVGLLIFLLLLAVLPPLVNVNRFQRQIAASISGSLGRTVHLDSATLTLLPAPGFTLTNFVIAEDPVFGAEPVIRAPTVRATLRASSLWRRRVEFSSISLSDPSVNLVRLPDGRWNLEGILLQASRISAAPTAQTTAGALPRFPYIEATGARVNLKAGPEKLPLSLTETAFALWLPEPGTWRLRIEGRPVRTDGPAMDTGILRVEGTLGHARSLPAVPLDLSGSWKDAPLGAVGSLVLGRDAGLRGSSTVTARVYGTVGDNAIETELSVRDLRRADFVPAHLLSGSVVCRAQSLGVFRSLAHLRCTDAEASGPTPPIELTGTLPDLFALPSGPSGATATLALHRLPAATLLDWARAGSQRIPRDAQLTGSLDGTLHWIAASESPHAPPPSLSGSLTGQEISFARESLAPLLDRAKVDLQLGSGIVTLSPLSLALGGALPAQLDCQADRTGYRCHLLGPATRPRLLTFAAAFPQIGDGLPDALTPPPSDTAVSPVTETPLSLDLVSERRWGGAQVWHAGIPPGRTHTHRRRSR